MRAVTTQDERTEPGLLTPDVPRRWAPAVFGVVPPGASRRRPGDIVSVGIAALLVVITALGADDLAAVEVRIFDLLDGFPEWAQTWAEIAYRAGTVGTVVVLLVALLASKRFRLTAIIAAAGALSWVSAMELRDLVDTEPERNAAGLVVDGSVPEYPVVVLAVATTILLVAAPYLLRPARRLVFASLAMGAIGAVFAIAGLPDDVVGALALGWGVASVFRLVVGTPAATPSKTQVDEALVGLGVDVVDLELADAQVWGETRFTATAPDGGAVSVEVIGRDAADAHLLAKVWRSIWFKDSGPTLALTRTQQLEHRAYLLLLAERVGVPVSSVVIAGIGGARETAVLVLREPGGVPLTEVDAGDVTDAVLDNTWHNLNLLHDARLAHGQMRAANILLRPDGTTAFVEFAHASSTAPAERCTRDAVELLVTTTALVGDDRALAAALRARGRDGLAEVLPMLEPAALSTPTRDELHADKGRLKGLREKGAELTGETSVELVKLRRVSATDILLAAGTILGVYLLLGELAGIDWSTTFNDAEWGWVAIAALLSFGPPFTGSVALMGSVAVPLPFKPVLGEQFANNFTGLIGGTAATTALVIRFFQKQGQKVAVAVSSGVLNSLAGGVVQITLVVVGLVITGDEFTPSSTGGKKIVGLVIGAIVIAAVGLAIALFVPKFRALVRARAGPQWDAAEANLRGILSTPRKALMLFGGNVATQVLFALVLDAALHAYGESLPLLQIIVINSLASVIGGMAPVPGGMGVIEAGLIAGFTAAGIPQSEAVAATFTARLFTAYLPPIWGWFALQWLRRNDYV